MYLATPITISATYQIRQSYLDKATGLYRHRLVFDLGPRPTDHIELLDGEIPYFNTPLLQAVRCHGAKNPDALLEQLLWDFLPNTTQLRLSRFQREHHDIPRPLSNDDRAAIAHQIHLFDRKRLYYLRYGAVDQGRLHRMHEKLCRPLLGQSRDEREYGFTAMEQVLAPGEYHRYIYAILNIQKHFTASFAPYLPEALAWDEVADHCVDELCRLNRNAGFWQGESMANSLHPHLRRYLIMLFDFTPANRPFFNDFVRRFMNSHRTFRWPSRKPKVRSEQVIELFGSSYEKLKKMSKQELNRLYRKRAMALHPDQGGDHDRFVQLSEIYTDLLKTKKS